MGRIAKTMASIGGTLFGAAAFAAPANSDAPADSEVPRHAQFDKGTWTFQTYGGYMNDLGPFDVEAGFASAGFSYYFVDGMSLGAEVGGYAIGQPGEDALAASAGLVFRHHLYDDGDASVFVDVVGSLFEATADVPSAGTRFNFLTGLGLGVTKRLDARSNLLVGVRYFHLSNANSFGDDRNPALNGITGYVGVMFKL